ncbi:ABC transporter ATP-binding protein [Desulfovermiculus halophilus]|uniref:ABC transporter ATP-binding protein n=1 Tax=Desulfovermiculus halophilus TaxID=339722 RepID=UPI000480D114|nr:ABC transporter ATP-binding protein [Desulfovermiculus halophilus]
MISIQGLTKYYDGFCAVNSIDLQVAQGEIVGLLGPNGAGKTTTLRILTGYLRPSGGNVRIKGLTPEQDLTEIKRHIGYLPESAPLYRNMLVYDYLCYVGRIRNLSPARLDSRMQEVVSVCGLKSIMHTPIGELSKGLKQRVGLAQALLHDPEILILDEPTSGLDPNQIQEMRSLIREIGRQKTVILSTHILSEAEATCDRMVIIHQGKIVADGSPESLKQDAAGQQIRLSLSGDSAQAIVSRLSAVKGVQAVSPHPQPETGPVVLTVTSDPDTDPRAAIYQTIKSTDWILWEFTPQARSLETIFQELTQEQ